VRKHAPGELARVSLDGGPGQGLTVAVANRLRPAGPGRAAPAAGPGGGGGAGPAVPGSGTGVIGLTERVELAGGRLDCRARDGEYALSAWLPWPA
jgi:hypothetical protein